MKADDIQQSNISAYDIIQHFKELEESFGPSCVLMNPNDIQRYFAGQKFLFKIRRNLNRKSKSHFRK